MVAAPLAKWRILVSESAFILEVALGPMRVRHLRDHPPATISDASNPPNDESGAVAGRFARWPLAAQEPSRVVGSLSALES